MTDRELLEKLGLGYEAAGNVIGVSRQVLHRALSGDPKRSRRGVARDAGEPAHSPKSYLNADRLLALWRHCIQIEDERSANIVRDEIVNRHPWLSKMIAPYEEQPEEPDRFDFSEIWIFSGEPLEISSPLFRQKMREPLRARDKRLVYFVPSNETAAKLLNVLQISAEGKLNEVFIIVTTAVLLCPHWFVAFVRSASPGGDETILAGVMPDPPRGLEIWERVVRVPHHYFINVRDTLMQAGLLDARDRFKLPAKFSVGGGAIPQFDIRHPKKVKTSA